MPWALEIHIIDVGQGESSLIIAGDPTTGVQRSMLIDAGLKEYASTVHSYVSAQLVAHGLAKLDHILVTHYDKDHSGGVTALLTADNLYRLCEVIAAAAEYGAGVAAALQADQDYRVAAAAAAAAATAYGGYDDGLGHDHQDVARAAAWAALAIPSAEFGHEPANRGADEGKEAALDACAAHGLNPPILPTYYIPTLETSCQGSRKRGRPGTG